jgi:type III restriction enzyme
VPKDEVNWIIETKGRKWEGTEDKDAAMDEWCKRITDYTGETWRFKRIDQVAFNRRRAQTLEDLVGAEEPLL